MSSVMQREVGKFRGTQPQITCSSCGSALEFQDGDLVCPSCGKISTISKKSCEPTKAPVKNVSHLHKKTRARCEYCNRKAVTSEQLEDGILRYTCHNCGTVELQLPRRCVSCHPFKVEACSFWVDGPKDWARFPVKDSSEEMRMRERMQCIRTKCPRSSKRALGAAKA